MVGTSKNRRRPAPWGRAALLGAAAVLAIGLTSAPGARADNLGAGWPDAIPTTELPRLLSEADADRYAEIFRLQAKGRWAKADRLIAKLDDRMLMGHVLFQRYMHPTHYRSRFHELRDWMKHHADHPGANRIYKLALRRKPAGAAAPRRPVGRYLTGAGGNIWGKDAVYRSAESKTASERRKARWYKVMVSRRLRRGWPTGALKLLGQREARRVFDAAERDALLARVARSYFFHDKDREAYRVADEAASRSGAFVPLTHWVAGIAAWRMERHEDARKHFEAVVTAPASSAWRQAAGAYWASRAHLKLGQHREVSRWLRRAAQHKRTFYGQIAASALGMEVELNFAVPPLESRDLNGFSRDRAGQRALALVQVDQDELAEQELRKLYGRSTPAMREAMLGLAVRSDMPALTMRLATKQARQGGDYNDLALWPVPHWRPLDGFSIDRALIYALMRQESAFQPRARSRVGARGLMQVMPGTARGVARAENLAGVNRKTMYDPALNLTLGQAYIQHLLESPHIQATLLHVLTGYNAGPGNVQRWDDPARHQDDPLLFIETVTFQESRDYVQKVLTNFWMYRHRLGQETPSRDSIAANDWPFYEPQDGDRRALADRGEDAKGDGQDR